MKVFAIAIMLAALYLLYRIAYPKPPATEKNSEIPQNRDADTKPDADDAVGKSHYVSAFRSQPPPTPATSLESGDSVENTSIFAPGNGRANAVIPSEELDDIFSEKSDDEVDENELDIDENEDSLEDLNADEEAEELRRTLGRDAELADGFSYDEMTQAIETADNPQGETAKAGEILYRMEKTDLFEQLVSGNAGRAARIKAIIDRHEQSLMPENAAENERNDDYSSFNIADFLS